MVAQRRDGGLHLPLVRRPAPPALRHGRDPRRATARPAWSTRWASPRSSRRWSRSWPSTSTPASSSRTTRSRCSTRTSGWPPATASTASSSTCPRASASRRKALARRLLDRLREHAQDLGLGRRARRDRGPAAPAATAPRASSSSTRPTTTCARSWRRSSRRRSADTGPDPRLAPSRSTRRRCPMARPTSSSSARTAAPRSARTSPSARTAGTRLRKRAPKIERDGTLSEPRPPRRPPQPQAPRLGRSCAPGEIPGIRGRALRRPYATLALVVLSLFGYLLLARHQPRRRRAWPGPSTASWWRLATTPFLYANVWYELAAVAAIGLFGWLLERRHGPLVVLALFFVGGVGGAALEVAVDGDAAARPRRQRRRAGPALAAWAVARPRCAAAAARTTTATCSASPSSRCCCC